MPKEKGSKEKNEKHFYKDWKFIVGTLLKIIAILATIIIGFHQLSQPILSSRIKKIEIDALYIQSQVEGGGRGGEPPLKFDYYKVFQIKYYIEPRLIGQSSVTIKIPENTELFGLTQGFQENNPYIETFEEELSFDMAKPFYTSNDFDEVEFKIKKAGFYMKEIPLTLYFREEVELGCSNPTFSNDPWWSTSTEPEKIPKIECYTQRIGYGKLKESGIVFSFDELTLTNRGELEVKGFVTRITENNIVQTRACEEGRELVIMDSGKNYVDEYISLDLKPGESRRIIILNQAPMFFDDDFDKIGFGKDKQKFYFENSGCLGDWNQYIK